MQPTNVKSGGTVGAAEIDQAVAQITPTVDRAPTVEALDDAVDAGALGVDALPAGAALFCISELSSTVARVGAEDVV